MKTYDWIVVGGGISGAALAYELTQAGLTVLLVDSDTAIQGATRYSYGGLAYWSGKSDLTRVLCAQGIERHRHLSAELDHDTQFRELDLVLTISADQNPETMAAAYANFAIVPKLLSVEEACELEPLLNPNAIAGVLTVRHGHIHPEHLTQGYRQAFCRAGGEQQIAQVVELLRQGDRVQGVKTSDNQTYHAANTVICAGGFSRALLKAAGIQVRVYFTHAEMVETPTVDLKLRTLVMPANTQRFQLEAQASAAEVEPFWDEPAYEPVPPILDAGAIQFLDGSLRMGQISRVLTQPFAEVNSAASEYAIRTQVGNVLPALASLPGTWHHCLVAFGGNNLPVVGAIQGVEGVYIFSGFTNPLVFVPPLAQRFAQWVMGKEDQIITQLARNF
ncbi:NAD(P)/FAD-dependent oxidoreductase [Coleofasciculus sp. G2-EDA-02]|uniref:NAD(P)/FAD-dependent oxidoreductase n=1 Tax=Coleofasciculus sp. G2-EDA-02 TaxID=3069529 RepID=UPI0032F909D6